MSDTLRIASLGDDQQESDAGGERPVWKLLQRSKRETPAWTKAGAASDGLELVKAVPPAKTHENSTSRCSGTSLSVQCRGAQGLFPCHFLTVCLRQIA